MPLSAAALETLALIAYFQPVTAAEIRKNRQVKTAGVLETLLQRKLIRIVGSKKTRGGPALYKTTDEFLIEFGIESLAHLPPLENFNPKRE
jgi:segregation and condensation protein B